MDSEPDEAILTELIDNIPCRKFNKWRRQLAKRLNTQPSRILDWKICLVEMIPAIPKILSRRRAIRRILNSSGAAIAQRSPEWFAARNGVSITGSMIYAALGSDAARLSAIREKIVPKPRTEDLSKMPKPIAHGQKLEDVARDIWLRLRGLSHIEIGFVRHRKYPWMGASPDGIISADGQLTELSDYAGMLMEIKCVYSRELVENYVKPEYYAQMQLQMAVCEIYECAFLEFDLKPIPSEEFAAFEPKIAKAVVYYLADGSSRVGYEIYFPGEAVKPFEESQYNVPVIAEYFDLRQVLEQIVPYEKDWIAKNLPKLESFNDLYWGFKAKGMAPPAAPRMLPIRTFKF